MNVEKLVKRVDHAQQDHRWLAFPIAVWKKFGDDQAGNLAALIAYYGFAALFPLLLVLVTVLDIVLRSNPTLKDQVLDSAFGQFPVIGPQLRNSVHGLNETGPAQLGIARAPRLGGPENRTGQDRRERRARAHAARVVPGGVGTAQLDLQATQAIGANPVA